MTGEIIHQSGLHNILLVGLKTNLRSTWEKFLSKHLPLYTLFYDWVAYRDHQKAFFKKNGRYDHCILMLNYEAVGKVVDKMVRWGKFEFVIYDEIQKNKSRNSANSRYARRLRSIPRRLGLSGTPMDKSPNDLWAVMRFIDYRVLGLSWADYAGFFTKPSGYMGYKRKFIDRLHPVYVDRIRPFVYRVTKQEAGIEPAAVKYLAVEMGSYQQRMYDELENDMMVDVKGELITTPLKIVQIGKLQQITGGAIKDEEGELHKVGDAKAKVLKRLLMKHDGPLVIFCKYTHEVELCRKIAATMFDRVEVLTGKVKDKQYKRKPDDLARTKLLKAFQRGEIDVLVAQQKTGGVGVDMYRARYAIVYSCNHSFIDFDQMTSRLDFLDQTEQAKFLVLYVPGTIDADIRSAIKLKTSVTTATLNRLRRKGTTPWRKPQRKLPRKPPKDRRLPRQRPLRPTSSASPKSRRSPAARTRRSA